MSQKPFLTLTAKEFLTGIAAGAHLGLGGLFFKADGITPLFDAGSAQSQNNGLLMAGAVPTQVLGNLNGNMIASAQFTNTSTTAYFLSSTGHIFSLVLDAAVSNTLADLHTVSGVRQGFEVYTTVNGGNMLFYFSNTHIGKYDLNSTFNDSWASISGDDIHCSHRYFDRLFFGNSGYIGQIMDDGSDFSVSSSANLNKLALAIGTKGTCTDISDDGIYLVIATTKNATCDVNALSGCSILFWDTYSTSWQREYQIPDPFIYALEHTPEGVFAFGVTGIWQVSFGKEPVKVFSRTPGIYSVNTNGNLKYGRTAASHYGDALMWGGASGSNVAIKSLGKLDSAAPNAYLHPFLSTANKNVTLVDGQLLKGWVFVGDDTPLLKAYPISPTATPATGVSAQTMYLPAPGKISLARIDVIFGEPLASGDSLSVGVYSDQDAAVKSFGTVSFASNGALHRKPFIGGVEVDSQFSLLLTYNGGSPKIKAIEFYDDQETP